MTAVKPPPMVKIAASARRIRTDTYNPDSPSKPSADLMNNAPENKSAYKKNCGVFRFAFGMKRL